MLISAFPENWIWLILSVLTVWRLTTLVCYESGPFHLMVRLRRWLYQLRLGSLLECFHCTSLWIAAGITVCIYKPGVALLFLVFAIAGGASLIEKCIPIETLTEENEDNT